LKTRLFINGEKIKPEKYDEVMFYWQCHMNEFNKKNYIYVRPDAFCDGMWYIVELNKK